MAKASPYREQFDALWELVLIVDPDGIIDLKFSEIAAVVGCSVDTARREWMKRVRKGVFPDG